MSLKTSRGERKKKLFSFGKKDKKKTSKDDTKELLKTVESVEKEGDVTAPTEIEGRVQSWKPFEAEDFKNWENEEEKKVEETPVKDEEKSPGKPMSPIITPEDEQSLDNHMANLKEEFSGEDKATEAEPTETSDTKTEVTEKISDAATKVAAATVAGVGFVVKQAKRCTTDGCSADVASNDNDTIFSWSVADSGIIEKGVADDAEKAEKEEEKKEEVDESAKPEPVATVDEPKEKTETVVETNEDLSEETPKPQEPEEEGTKKSLVESFVSICSPEPDLSGCVPSEKADVNLDKSFQPLIANDDDGSILSAMTGTSFNTMAKSVSKKLPEQYHLDDDFKIEDKLQSIVETAQGTAQKVKDTALEVSKKFTQPEKAEEDTAETTPTEAVPTEETPTETQPVPVEAQ